jgi:hypothetical protein
MFPSPGDYYSCQYNPAKFPARRIIEIPAESIRFLPCTAMHRYPRNAPDSLMPGCDQMASYCNA